MLCGIASISCFVLFQTLASIVILRYFVLIWSFLFYFCLIFCAFIVSSRPKCVWFCVYLFFTIVNFCILSIMEVVLLYICYCSFCMWFCSKAFLLSFCTFLYLLFLFLILILVLCCSLFSFISLVIVYLLSLYLSNTFLLFLRPSISWSSTLHAWNYFTAWFAWLRSFVLFVLVKLSWFFCPSFFAACCSVLLVSQIIVSAGSSVPNEATAIFPSFHLLSFLIFMPSKSCFSCNFSERSRSLILSNSISMTYMLKLSELFSLLFSFFIMYWLPFVLTAWLSLFLFMWFRCLLLLCSFFPVQGLFFLILNFVSPVFFYLSLDL